MGHHGAIRPSPRFGIKVWHEAAPMVQWGSRQWAGGGELFKSGQRSIPPVWVPHYLRH